MTRENKYEELEKLLQKSKLLEGSSSHLKQSIQLQQCMEYCLENMDLISCYSRDESSSLDQAIVQGILKSREFKKDADKLRLALQWQRSDLAADFIKLQSDVSTTEYEEIMLKALQKNQLSLIERILHTGVISMKSFVTTETLEKLYSEHSNKESPLLKGLIHVVKTTKDKYTKDNVGKLLDVLLGRSDSNPFVPDQDEGSLFYDGKHANHLMTDKLNDQSGSQIPYVHLFLWCVLSNKLDIGMLFWERCREQLALAVAAQQLCTSLRQFASNCEEEKFLEENARFYGNLAVDFLTHLYRDNEQRCRILILAKTKTFGGLVPLKLAVHAENLKFLAHYASQSVLESIWNGTIQPEASTFKVILTLCMPFCSSETIPSTEQRNLGATLQRDKFVRILSRPAQEPRKYCGCFDIYQAPRAKFYLHCISHIVFLCLLSVSLTSYFDRTFVFLDWILIVWVATFVLEEVREVFEWKNLRSYLSNAWNLMDVLSILAYTVALLLRLLSCQQCLVCARITGSLSNIGFFMAAFNFLTVSRRLGPKILMIGQMLIDLVAYVVVLLIFVICFGVMIQAVLHPGRRLDLTLVRDVLRMPYFQIYGELFLEDLEACQQKPGNITLGCGNETARVVLPIFLGVYVLITNVLVLNLIIAMFSFTVTRIHENTDEIWRMQRYSLVRSYSTRPVLPPPLVGPELVIRAIHSCCIKYGLCPKRTNHLRIDMPASERKALQAWEALNAYEFIRKRKGMQAADDTN